MLALLLLAAPVAATPAPEVIATQAGTVGVTFTLPTADANKTVGLTYFLTPDVAARLDVGLYVPFTPSGGGQNANFSVGLGLRFYQLRHGAVALYLQPSAAIGREPSPQFTDGAGEFFRVGAGVGVEYFFTPRFSAGGTLEVAFKVANLAAGTGAQVYTSLGTGTSSLSANFYF